MSLTPATPGQVGFLVISDTGAVLSSGGDLQVGLVALDLRTVLYRSVAE